VDEFVLTAQELHRTLCTAETAVLLGVHSYLCSSVSICVKK
jgi:hypothetical protein